MFWDLFITTALVFICTVMPFHLAFDIKTFGWCVTYYLIDACFWVDIVIIFFTTIPATENDPEIDDYKTIAKKYFGEWFLVDLLAIMPFDLILAVVTQGDFTLCDSDACIIEKSKIPDASSDSKANILLRAPKLQKIMKSIRLFRMVKLIKLVKNSAELEKKFHNGLKISSGIERLVLLGATIIYVAHLFACAWIMIG